MADNGHATSSSYFEHDVFLSFRGDDTRHGFTDHLYSSLKEEKEINIFRDDPGLRLGDEIRPALLEAIEKSRMSIVVLSGNYASSTWCLDELVKIMECKDRGRPVIPVFYHIEPREVRYQENQYKTAMIKHENRYGRDSPKVAAWRSALVAVSGLSGASCNKNRPEREIINKIVKDVENKKICFDEGEFEGNKRLRVVEEEDVVGFMSNFCAVINQLKEKDSSRNVVSITGMGGLGKTTLARKIYNSNEVKKLFPYRAWSCVSKDFKVREVLVSLLNCLVSSMSEYEKLSEAKLKEEGRKILDRKKYLIVLDDVWEPEVWDKVKEFFPNNNNGSMILITTRNERVANYTRSRDPHQQLPFLDEEESWELFCKKVFSREKCPPGLKPIGRSIVKSCQGLPLAIITLAGLVATRNRSEIEWQQIEGLVPYWYIAEDEDSTKVMNILKFSYDDLPKKLKPCFLYFGIYPEDYEIPVRELIQLWVAEGFIQLKKTGRSKVPQLEDIGEEYLKDLVDRNLVQVAKRRSDGEGVKTCRIHDLLRELCISESSKADNFLEVYTESNNNTISDSRRLSFLCDAWSYISSRTCNQSCTHSLFFFGRECHSDGEWRPDRKWRSADQICENFQSVNVLHFANEVYHAIQSSYLNRLIHLRYLRIRRLSCNKIDCIWSLQNLETLDIRDTDMTMPKVRIWKLKRLRHLHTRESVELLVDERGANDQTMQNLQTLSYVRADPQLGFLLDNGCIPNLRKLGLRFKENQRYSVVEQLRSLHRLSKLHALKIYGPVRPVFSLDAIAFPSNLTKITLKHFADLDSKSLNALGRITKLRILKLEHVREWCLNFGPAGNFPQLQVLHMRYMSVMWVILEDGAMPFLRRVVIHGCGELEKAPQRLLALSNLRHKTLESRPQYMSSDSDGNSPRYIQYLSSDGNSPQYMSSDTNEESE